MFAEEGASELSLLFLKYLFLFTYLFIGSPSLSRGMYDIGFLLRYAGPKGNHS